MTELITATSTQFECLRIVMDSLDIETNNKAWVGFDGRTYTHEEFANTVRSTHDDARAINEALKHVADMLGYMTSIEYQSGEEAAVNIVRHMWRTALKTYETTLNERVSKPR